MITEEDKDEFIGQMRGLAFTEDGRYEAKAKELLNELIDEIKGQTLPIDSVSGSYETIVTTIDGKKHKVFVPNSYDATQILNYYDQIFKRWLDWKKV